MQKIRDVWPHLALFGPVWQLIYSWHLSNIFMYVDYPGMRFIILMKYPPFPPHPTPPALPLMFNTFSIHLLKGEKTRQFMILDILMIFHCTKYFRFSFQFKFEIGYIFFVQLRNLKLTKYFPNLICSWIQHTLMNRWYLSHWLHHLHLMRAWKKRNFNM